MYNWFSKLMNNDIAVNLVIDFFYSAIIGLIILALTNFLEQKKALNNLLIDLTKLTFVLNTIHEPVSRLSKLDGAEYRKFFASVLDGKEIKVEEIKTVSEFIIYDEIPYLPNLNNYLIDKFNDYINKIVKFGEENFINLLGKSKDEKMRYIIENNAFVISYEDINRRIARLNNKLNYYRELTLEIIGFDLNDLKSDNIATKNKLRIFKSCIDTLIYECKSLEESLELLDETVFKNKNYLNKEFNRTKNILCWSIRVFIIIIVICLVLLIID